MRNELDLPIGFQFVEGNDVLEVRRESGTPDDYCRGCYFLISVNGVKKCSGCSLMCTAMREDETDVIFAKVGEVQHE